MRQDEINKRRGFSGILLLGSGIFIGLIRTIIVYTILLIIIIIITTISIIFFPTALFGIGMAGIIMILGVIFGIVVITIKSIKEIKKADNNITDKRSRVAIVVDILFPNAGKIIEAYKRINVYKVTQMKELSY